MSPATPAPSRTPEQIAASLLVCADELLGEGRLAFAYTCREAAALLRPSPLWREFEHDARLLAKSLPDDVLEGVRELWGNTNVAVVKHWRDAVLARLAAQPADFRQRCVCRCCDHAEGSDCACDCHATGKCAAQPETPKCPRCNGAGVDTYVNPAAPSGFTERPCPACQPAPKDDLLRQARDFTELMAITFRNYYAKAVSRAEVQKRLAEWLTLRAEMDAALASPPPPKENQP